MILTGRRLPEESKCMYYFHLISEHSYDKIYYKQKVKAVDVGKYTSHTHYVWIFGSVKQLCYIC